MTWRRRSKGRSRRRSEERNRLSTSGGGRTLETLSLIPTGAQWTHGRTDSFSGVRVETSSRLHPEEPEILRSQKGDEPQCPEPDSSFSMHFPQHMLNTFVQSEADLLRCTGMIFFSQCQEIKIGE